jgi:hypothetical protein
MSIVDALDAADLLDAISKARLTGFALASLHDGALRLPSAYSDELLERHAEQRALDHELNGLLSDVANVLDDAGIAYRALKGPLLAHTVYRTPELRSYGDIDILVHGDDFDAVVQLLDRYEFRRRFLEPRPGFDARFSKGACLERGDGMEIDLHRTFAPGVYGALIGRANLFGSTPEVFELGGVLVRGLDRDRAFVHACFHAVLGDDPPRLTAVRDVAEIAARGVDARMVMKLVDSTGCGAVIHRAIALVQEQLGVVVTAPVANEARAYRVSRFDRWALRTYTGPDRSYAAQTAATMWAMPGVRDRAAYASALLFPSPDYVRARGSGRAQRLLDGVRLSAAWRPR